MFTNGFYQQIVIIFQQAVFKKLIGNRQPQNAVITTKVVDRLKPGFKALPVRIVLNSREDMMPEIHKFSTQNSSRSTFSFPQSFPQLWKRKDIRRQLKHTTYPAVS